MFFARHYIGRVASPAGYIRHNSIHRNTIQMGSGAGTCPRFSGGSRVLLPHGAYLDRPERVTAVLIVRTSRNGQHQQRYVVVPMPVAVFGHGVKNSFLQFCGGALAVLRQKAKQPRLPKLLALRIVRFRHPIGE
jgi:hypothetical protein